MPMQAWADKSVGQVLRDAAEVIRQDGWCQGSIRDMKGQVCLLGALAKAAGYEYDWPPNIYKDNEVYDWLQPHPACAYIFDYIEAASEPRKLDSDSEADVKPLLHQIWYYNDYVASSAEDVINLLNDAADKWEASQK